MFFAATDLSSPPDAASKTDETTVRSPLMHITSFFAALTSSGADARIVVTKCADDAWLKFLALNPSFHFKDILDVSFLALFARLTQAFFNCWGRTERRGITFTERLTKDYRPTGAAPPVTHFATALTSPKFSRKRTHFRA